jgi:DNA repair exonuclease SbcCD nuclease subunit
VKVLFVGDIHATQNSLDECWRLIKLIKTTADQYSVNSIVFLGDQYDTHAMVHVNVQRFWLTAFEYLKEHRVIALVGNHDMPNGNEFTAHSMQVHHDVIVVDQSPRQVDGLGMVGYVQNDSVLKQTEGNILVCHHTFQGAKYENGFYAKEATDPAVLNKKLIISGHIHTPAQFANVWYPGSPRWLTAADANIDRYIYVLNMTLDSVVSFEKIPTHIACRRIWKLEDRESAPLDPTSLEFSDSKVIIDIHGSAVWVDARKKMWAQPDVRVRTFPEASKIKHVRESEGINTSFVKFFEGYRPLGNTDKNLLQTAVKELNVG